MVKEVKETQTELKEEVKPEEVRLDQIVAEEVTPEQSVPQAQPVEQQAPETVEIVIVGKASSGKTAILAQIIKNCLERDYDFRSYFEGMNVQLRQLVEPDVRPNTKPEA